MLPFLEYVGTQASYAFWSSVSCLQKTCEAVATTLTSAIGNNAPWQLVWIIEMAVLAGAYLWMDHCVASSQPSGERRKPAQQNKQRAESPSGSRRKRPPCRGGSALLRSYDSWLAEMARGSIQRHGVHLYDGSSPAQLRAWYDAGRSVHESLALMMDSAPDRVEI